MMLEKELWQQLPPAAIKTVNLAGLLGDGAPVLMGSPLGLSRESDSRSSHTLSDQGMPGKEESKAGFAFWLEKGNPFSERKSHGLILANTDFKHATKTMGESHISSTDNEQFKVSDAASCGTMTNGALEHHDSNLNDELNEDEDEDLLADFIDEDSQLPSRVYRGSNNGSSKDKRAQVITDEDLTLTGSAVGILRQFQNFSLADFNLHLKYFNFILMVDA